MGLTECRPSLKLKRKSEIVASSVKRPIFCSIKNLPKRN